MDFNKILATPSEKIERPKPFPAGHYTVLVTGPPEYPKIKTKNGEAQKVQWKVKALQADLDVDQTLLIESGGLDRPFPIMQVYLGVTEEEIQKSLFRIKEFAIACGVEEAGKNVKELAEATQNRQVKVQIGHRASDDGTMLYAEIKRALPV